MLGVIRGTTKVMGVVNVTPDSFSDGGLWHDSGAAIAHAGALIDEGADMVDIGGESTRPGSDPVGVEEELRRVLPVVRGVHERWPGVEISIDTNKPEVARLAVDAGASIINDVTASLDAVAADTGAGWIAMHAGGPSKTMQNDPHYEDVVEDVAAYLGDAVARARSRGVERIWIDPGIGFGKTLRHNLELVANLDYLVAIAPVLLGVSRKRTIGELHAESDGAESVAADDRLDGSLAMATYGAYLGADIVRVHDVRATVHAVGVVAP